MSSSRKRKIRAETASLGGDQLDAALLKIQTEVRTVEAKEAVFRRSSFAVRRSRHRVLMMTGTFARCWRSGRLLLARGGDERT